MSEKMSKRALYKIADVDMDVTDATYFPFPEPVEAIAHSEGVYGCTGILYKGRESGALYVGDAYTCESQGYELRRALGNRERAVVEKLDHVEQVESEGARFSVLRFVACDGYSFTAVTRDYGHNWTICG